VSYRRNEGQLNASELLISDGAQVECSIIAQDVTVCGRVKGTSRAVRVRLQNGGLVEGDIFHKSLSIDENFQFEGSSRRVENPTEPLTSIAAKDPQKKDMKPARAPSSAIIVSSHSARPSSKRKMYKLSLLLFLK